MAHCFICVYIICKILNSFFNSFLFNKKKIEKDETSVIITIKNDIKYSSWVIKGILSVFWSKPIASENELFSNIVVKTAANSGSTNLKYKMMDLLF